MTLDEKVAQLLTIWEQKSKVQTPDGQFSAEKASQAFPNGIGGMARPSDRRGVTASNGAAGAAADVGRNGQHVAWADRLGQLCDQGRHDKVQCDRLY